MVDVQVDKAYAEVRTLPLDFVIFNIELNNNVLALIVQLLKLEEYIC